MIFNERFSFTFIFLVFYFYFVSSKTPEEILEERVTFITENFQGFLKRSDRLNITKDKYLYVNSHTFLIPMYTTKPMAVDPNTIRLENWLITMASTFRVISNVTLVSKEENRIYEVNIKEFFISYNETLNKFYLKNITIDIPHFPNECNLMQSIYFSEIKKDLQSEGIFFKNLKTVLMSHFNSLLQDNTYLNNHLNGVLELAEDMLKRNKTNGIIFLGFNRTETSYYYVEGGIISMQLAYDFRFNQTMEYDIDTIAHCVPHEFCLYDITYTITIPICTFDKKMTGYLINTFKALADNRLYYYINKAIQEYNSK